MGLPKPFQRPGINLSSKKKDWVQVSVYSVKPGDMVRGMGLVTDIWDYPSGVIFQFKSGDQHSYDEHDTVLAFVTV